MPLAGGAVELADTVSQAVEASGGVGDGSSDVLVGALKAAVLPEASIDAVDFTGHRSQAITDGVVLALQGGGTAPDSVVVVH